MALVLEKVDARGVVSRHVLDVGRNQIPAEPGLHYRIIDEAKTGKSVQATTKRIGTDLVIDDLPNQTVVELDNFFSACTPTQSCSLSMEGLGGAAGTEITPATEPVAALTDGSFVMFSGGGTASAVTPMAAEGTGFGVKAAGIGLVALGLAAAAGGGGGGGGGGDSGGGSSVLTGPQPLAITSKSLTNSDHPVLSGTGTPNERIAITLSSASAGSVFYNANVDANGQWSVDTATATPLSGSIPATGLGDGSYTVTAHSPTAGTVDSTQALTIDRVAPAAPIITGPADNTPINAETAKSGVVISGTAEAGSTVTVSFVGIAATAVAGADGHWSATLTGSNIAGSGDIRNATAVATDAAGNTGPSSAPIHLVLQTGQPAAPVVDNVTTDNIVNAAEHSAGVVLTGTTSPNATVTIVWGAITHTATANASGIWSSAFASVDIPGDGQSRIDTTARDSFGNTSTSTHTLTLDTAAPTSPTIATVGGDDVINSREHSAPVVINGTAEAGSTVHVTWGGNPQTATTAADGTWSVAFPAGVALGGDGSKPVSAYAVDVAGNQGATTVHAVTLDTVTSTPAIATVAGDNVINIAENGSNVIVSGSAEAGSSVVVTWGAVSQTVTASAGGSWSAGFTPSATGGAQTITAVASDTAGNPSVSASHHVDFDLSRPNVVSITDSVSASTTNGADTFFFAFNEALSGFSASNISVSGGSKGAFSQIDSSHYSLVVSPNAGTTGTMSVSLGPGNYHDVALNDNTDSASLSQGYATVTPVITITDNMPGTTNAATTFSFAFTVAPTSFSVNDISVTGGTKGALTSTDSTHYSLVVTPTAGVNSGSMDVSVAANQVHDSANNGNSAASHSQAYDTQAPTLTITDSFLGVSTNAPDTFSFAFNEVPTGFSTASINVSGGTKGAFTTVDSSHFTLVVTPDVSTTGTIVVSVAPGGFSDAASNSNSTTISDSQAFDTQARAFTLTNTPPLSTSVTLHLSSLLDAGTATGETLTLTRTDTTVPASPTSAPVPWANGTVSQDYVDNSVTTGHSYNYSGSVTDVAGNVTNLLPLSVIVP